MPNNDLEQNHKNKSKNLYKTDEFNEGQQLHLMIDEYTVWTKPYDELTQNLRNEKLFCVSVVYSIFCYAVMNFACGYILFCGSLERGFH